MTGIPTDRLKAGTLRLGSPKTLAAPVAAPATVHPAPDPADVEERARRKAENLRQEGELQRQARARRAQQTNTLLAELRNRWPHLFTKPVGGQEGARPGPRSAQGRHP